MDGRRYGVGQLLIVVKLGQADLVKHPNVKSRPFHARLLWALC